MEARELGLTRFQWWLMRITYRAWNYWYGIKAKRKLRKS